MGWTQKGEEQQLRQELPPSPPPSSTFPLPTTEATAEVTFTLSTAHGNALFTAVEHLSPDEASSEALERVVPPASGWLAKPKSDLGPLVVTSCTPLRKTSAQPALVRRGEKHSGPNCMTPAKRRRLAVVGGIGRPMTDPRPWATGGLAVLLSRPGTTLMLVINLGVAWWLYAYNVPVERVAVSYELFVVVRPPARQHDEWQRLIPPGCSARHRSAASAASGTLFPVSSNFVLLPVLLLVSGCWQRVVLFFCWG